MLTEIDKDFYCSGHSFGGVEWCNNRNRLCVGITKDNITCECLHRKHPTPQQFKEEYGEEYPDDGAVYIDVTYIFPDKDGNPQRCYAVHSYWKYKEMKQGYEAGRPITNPYFGLHGVYCACTPFGKPPLNWRPE